MTHYANAVANLVRQTMAPQIEVKAKAAKGISRSEIADLFAVELGYTTA